MSRTPVLAEGLPRTGPTALTFVVQAAYRRRRAPEVVVVTQTGPTDRRGLRVLSMNECLALLREASVGRLGFVHHGEPDVLPVNFGMDGSSPVFRSTWGSKLDTASVGGLVALEADDVDLYAGHAWSVVLKGRAVVEYGDDAIARYESLDVPSWLSNDTESFWVRVQTESVTGRQLDLP